MKIALSISFIAIIVFVMVLGFYETTNASDVGQCYNECFPNYICVSDPEIPCLLTIYCNGWHDLGRVNCQYYLEEYCCAEGCPC
jgi:hypothetical protein